MAIRKDNFVFYAFFAVNFWIAFLRLGYLRAPFGFLQPHSLQMNLRISNLKEPKLINKPCSMRADFK